MPHLAAGVIARRLSARPDTDLATAPTRQIGPAAIQVPEPGTVCQCSLSPPTTDRLRD